MRRIAAVVALVAVGLAAIGLGAWQLWSRWDKGPAFRTAPVKRGDLVATITATGTVEPEAAVDVGAQVAGVIIGFGKDKDGKPVSWGSTVEAGTVLARIDDSLYAAAVRTATAQVAQTEANVLASQANVLQQKASLLHATQDWGRAQKLGPSDALSQSAYDQYQATYEIAKANLAASEAAAEQTKAAVEQAKAALRTAQINLDYCTIKSPVKGVVIDRRVNIGQTVVSSLSAPSLFLIANDLKRIQVWVSVNEADVGNISQGQAVTFTVDAFPGRIFHGTVGQVRLNATMTQNVVTYTIQVDIDNSDGKLLPYLTANTQFEIGRRQDVLQVPNAALRWTPKPGQMSPDLKQEGHGRFSHREHGEHAEHDPAAVRTTVWIEDGKFVRPVFVTAGLSDGTFTEVEGRNLNDAMRVVVGEASREGEAAGGERNPFAPQVFRGQRGGGRGEGEGQGQGNQEQNQNQNQENQGQPSQPPAR